MIPDGYYKAKWETGLESDEFEVTQGRYTLNGKEYRILYRDGQIKFEWGDAYGSIQ